MPTPTEAAPAPQSEPIASTPVNQPDKPLTTQPTPDENQPSLRSISEHLDLPDEIKNRLFPKEQVQAQPEPTVEVQPEVTTDETKPEDQTVKQETPPKDSGYDTEGDGEEGEDSDVEQSEGKEPDWRRIAEKRQKRINRLTRQKSEIETKLDAAFQQPAQPQQPAQQAAAFVPSKTRLAYLTDEQSLNQEVAKANGVLDWCDENSEGVTIEENGTERFIEPKQVSKWRSDAEKVVLNAPLRLQEIQSFNWQKVQFDNAAKSAFPEIFDPKTPEYQLAQQILRDFPALKETPRGNYDIGIHIKGLKTMQAEAQSKNGNGVPKPKGDIDPKVFTTPRVPIAPHTAQPPSRESGVSSKQKVNEAMSSHLKDPEGDGLVRMFEALEEANRGNTTARSPVNV